jgi:DeoR family transcriptional regulator, catabolite repression regulator
MNTLSFLKVEEVDHLVTPEILKEVTFDTSALEILTDYRDHPPPLINGDVLAVDAERLMFNEYEKIKLVVDRNKEFIGLVSYQQLSSQNILKQVANGYYRDEIRVADLMLPRERINAVDYSALAESSIGELIASLKQHGERYCLVVDKYEHHIRGVVSAEEIAKRLRIPVVIYRSPTFATIFSTLVSKH